MTFKAKSIKRNQIKTVIQDNKTAATYASVCLITLNCSQLVQWLYCLFLTFVQSTYTKHAQPVFTSVQTQIISIHKSVSLTFWQQDICQAQECSLLWDITICIVTAYIICKNYKNVKKITLQIINYYDCHYSHCYYIFIIDDYLINNPYIVELNWRANSSL